MFGYYLSAAPLTERLGLLKMGEVLRNEYRIVDAPMPERLTALLMQLERSKQSTVVPVGESCPRPFDRLDDVIGRSVVPLFAK